MGQCSQVGPSSACPMFSKRTSLGAAGRGPLTTLLMAELDSLVDEMSYEELYEVFGGA
jgi:hypothetical protein